ncbi:MAG: lipopolysaccharide assembly protein LapA domain-containing protein [Streptosporangiaceae bacterium]
MTSSIPQAGQTGQGPASGSPDQAPEGQLQGTTAGSAPPAQAVAAPVPAAAVPAAPVPAAAGPAPVLPQHTVRRTRVGGIWIASALFALVLLLLLIFILENGNKVEISYFGAHGHLPLGVALLMAAVLGILLVVIPGTARIVQLRMTARRHRRSDARVTAQPVAPAVVPAGTPDAAVTAENTGANGS